MQRTIVASGCALAVALLLGAGAGEAAKPNGLVSGATQALGFLRPYARQLVEHRQTARRLGRSARRDARAVTPPEPGKKPVVLITGASTGVGRELGRRFAATGEYHVILTARGSSMARFDELAWTKDPDVSLLELDVADPRQRQAAIAKAVAQHGGIDVLVNNAGTGYMSSVEHDTDAQRHAIMETNFHAPMSLAKEVIPFMRQKGRGRILNVSSIASGIGAQLASSYIASRGALDAATESLRHEMAPFGVQVSLISPGWIRNDAHKRMVEGLPSNVRTALDDRADPYHDGYGRMIAISRWGSQHTNAREELVAASIFDAARAARPRGHYWVTGDARWFDRLRRVLPQRAYETFIEKNTDLPWGR